MFVTHTWLPATANPHGSENPYELSERVRTKLPSLALNSVTVEVLLPTQTLVPSNAMPFGRLKAYEPPVNVCTQPPLLSLISVTELAVLPLFATHRWVPSKANPEGWSNA